MKSNETILHQTHQKDTTLQPGLFYAMGLVLMLVIVGVLIYVKYPAAAIVLMFFSSVIAVFYAIREFRFMLKAVRNWRRHRDNSVKPE